MVLEDLDSDSADPGLVLEDRVLDFRLQLGLLEGLQQEHY